MNPSRAANDATRTRGWVNSPVGPWWLRDLAARRTNRAVVPLVWVVPAERILQHLRSQTGAQVGEPQASGLLLEVAMAAIVDGKAAADDQAATQKCW